MYAVEIVFRNGRNFGSNTHYPYVYKEEDNGSLVGKFIIQFYNNNKNIPTKIFTSIEINENLLQKALEIQNKIKLLLEYLTLFDIKIIEEGLATTKNLADKISKNSNIKELNAQIKKNLICQIILIKLKYTIILIMLEKQL